MSFLYTVTKLYGGRMKMVGKGWKVEKVAWVKMIRSKRYGSSDIIESDGRAIFKRLTTRQKRGFEDFIKIIVIFCSRPTIDTSIATMAAGRDFI